MLRISMACRSRRSGSIGSRSCFGYGSCRGLSSALSGMHPAGSTQHTGAAGDGRTVAGICGFYPPRRRKPGANHLLRKAIGKPSDPTAYAAANALLGSSFCSHWLRPCGEQAFVAEARSSLCEAAWDGIRGL